MAIDNQAANANAQADKTLSRRGFLEWMIGLLGGISVLSVAGTILAYLTPPSDTGKGGAVQVAVLSEIPVGEARVVSFNSSPAIIIHTPKAVVAFSAVCTHAGCVVTWQKDKKRIFCPCHAGTFDLEGNVVSGPPPRSLKKIRVVVQGEKILLAES